MKIILKSAFTIFILPAFLLLCLGTLAHAQSPNDGQAVVVDISAGTDFDGALFIVELSNGQRELVSDFGDPAQGPLGDGPVDLALSQNLQNAYVTDTSGQGLLFHVNLMSGDRTIISDFADPAQGPLGERPSGIALNDTAAYVLTRSEGTNDDGLLFHIDLTTGDRTIISDFGDPAQGIVGSDPADLILDGTGGAYVTDEDGGDSLGRGAVFHVDLTSGNRTLISNFNNPAQGPIGINPFGITMGSSGNLLVTDEDITQGPTINGSLLEVDVVSGFRTVISDFENPAQGPLGNEPQGITTNLLGQALIAERNGQSGGGRGFLFLVDTTTGDRTIISDFGNPAQGPLGSDPTGIAYRLPLRNVPTLSQWGLIATAGLLGIIGFLVIRRRQLATNK